MTARAPFAAAALVAAALARAAGAQETIAVLTLADPPGPGPELVAASERLRAALAERISGVLAPSELRERMVGRPSPASLAELERAHAGAITAHAAGDFEGSIRTLRTVVAALEALPEGPEAFAQWTRAMFRLARSEQELGRRGEAQAVLERLLRAAPDARPDARQYPPSFLALADEVRERLRALGARRLTVESQPEARIFVEGREVGSSPVSVTLPPGRYRVAAGRGALRVRTFADVAEGDRTVAIDTSALEVLRPDAGPGLALPERDRTLGVVTAASRLGLDRAVTTAIAREGEVAYLVATLLDVRRGAAEREGRLRLDGGAPPEGGVAALAALVATGQPSPLLSAPPAPSLAVEAPRPAAVPLALPPPAPRSRASRWMVRTGVASALAAGTTLYLALDASDRYADARAMLDGTGRVQPGLSVLEYNAAIREGDRRRDAAVAAGVATGVGLAVTAVLGYVTRGEPAEPGTIRF